MRVFHRDFVSSSVPTLRFNFFIIKFDLLEHRLNSVGPFQHKSPLSKSIEEIISSFNFDVQS